MNRRQFVQQTGLLGAALAGGRTLAAPTMPTIRLGQVEVSRFILGSNPFWGYAHQPGDLGRRMVEYFTDERIAALLDEAAGYGVTAVASPPDARWVKLWTAYRAGGGKLPHWIAQPHRDAAQMDDEIDEAVEAGASAAFVQGHRVEVQFEGGTFDRVNGWLERIRARGLPAGMAAHRPDIHPEAQRRGFAVDFFFQCFYNVAHGDTYDAADRDRAAATVALLEKPVVAYKILGAGRNDPRAAFDYALRRIRPTDGVCVGIHPQDRPTELRDDVRLLLGV